MERASGRDDILGHYQIAVTMNIYGHIMPATQQEAAAHIDAARARRPHRRIACG
jgi:integrase